RKALGHGPGAVRCRAGQRSRGENAKGFMEGGGYRRGGGAAALCSSCVSCLPAVRAMAKIAHDPKNTPPPMRQTGRRSLASQQNGNNVPVPGPVIGAGLPGIVASAFGLLALVRRRRKLVA